MRMIHKICDGCKNHGHRDNLFAVNIPMCHLHLPFTELFSPSQSNTVHPDCLRMMEYEVLSQRKQSWIERWFGG